MPNKVIDASGCIVMPGLIDLARRQDSQILRAALILPLPANQALQFEWRQLRNDETIALFNYKSQLLQLSWTWQAYR